jgi:hypothetical protein
MSWGSIFNNVEIEGAASKDLTSSDPYSWFPGRGRDGVVGMGAGRMEIAHDVGCCAGEEISDLDYRAMVVKKSLLLARSRGHKSPTARDVAEAQRSVDSDLSKRDVSRSFSW